MGRRRCTEAHERSCGTNDVQVAVRIRPLLARERDGSECVEKVENEPQIVVAGRRSFTYDFAFEPSSQQEEIYKQCVEPLVGAFFEGFNATVLAYGQTGSGKTYTMGSAAHGVYLQAELGVIPRVILRIFKMIEERSVDEASEVEFAVSVTFIEIYGEDVRDLLADDSRSETCGIGAVTVRELEGELTLVGATQLVVKSSADTLDALERGSLVRTTASTMMNDTSSRSHAIFSISLSSTRGSDGDAVEAEVTGKRAKEENEFRSSKFHFVDLAGSERAKRTGASGLRMREGININKGLLALGNVISSLGDQKKRAAGAHVPYRDSKLTRILQDSLGGNSRTLMVACVSPADDSMEETLNALKYANRARNIKNKAIINRDPRSLQLAALRLRISQLSADLARNGITPSVGTLVRGNADGSTVVDGRDRGSRSGGARSEAGGARSVDGVDWQTRAEEADSVLQRMHATDAKRKVELDRINTERIAAQAEREWYREMLATAYALAKRLRALPLWCELEGEAVKVSAAGQEPLTPSSTMSSTLPLLAVAPGRAFADEIIAVCACGVPVEVLRESSEGVAARAAAKVGIATISALQAEVEELSAKLERSNAATRELLLSSTPSLKGIGEGGEAVGCDREGGSHQQMGELVYVDGLVEEIRAKIAVEKEQLEQMRLMRDEDEKVQTGAARAVARCDGVAAEGSPLAENEGRGEGEGEAVEAAAATRVSGAAPPRAVSTVDVSTGDGDGADGSGGTVSAEEESWLNEDREKLRVVEYSFEQRQMLMRAEWQRAENDIKVKEKLVWRLELQQRRFVGMEKHYKGRISVLNERMAEAEKSRTALVLELERVELEAQGEVHSLDSASEGSSAAAKAALERQRAAAQALRRKLKMKDAQLAQLRKQRGVISQFSKVKSSKEGEIRSLQADIQRKRAEKVTVERRMHNEKKLFEAKLRQHRIEIKAETRNRKRVERELRALKLRHGKREEVLLRKNRALVSAQQRVRQGRRVRAGARQVPHGGARAALEKERKSYTFVQSLLQRFSDSEQVHEQLEDMRGELGEKKAELKQRVQRREGITKYMLQLSETADPRIVDEARRAFEEESASIDSLKAVVNHTGERLRTLRAKVGRYGELSEEAMLGRLEARFQSRADTRMCTTILARMMLSQKRGEGAAALDVTLLRDELSERTAQVRERQKTLVKQSMKLSKMSKRIEELEADLFDMPSLDEIEFSLSLPRGGTPRDSATRGADATTLGAAAAPIGGEGRELGVIASAAQRTLLASTAAAVTPPRASPLSASCASAVPISASAAAPVGEGASFPPRPPATCPPVLAQSYGDDDRGAPSTEALRQVAAVLSPGVIARFSNPRRYAGVAGRQRYKAGESRAHAVIAVGCSSLSPSTAPDGGRLHGAGAAQPASSSPSSSAFMSKLRGNASTRLERYGGSAVTRESAAATTGAQVAQQRLKMEGAAVAQRLAAQQHAAEQLPQLQQQRATAAMANRSSISSGGSGEAFEPGPKKARESVQARRQRRSASLKAMHSNLAQMHSGLNKTGAMRSRVNSGISLLPRGTISAEQHAAASNTERSVSQSGGGEGYSQIQQRRRKYQQGIAATSAEARLGRGGEVGEK